MEPFILRNLLSLGLTVIFLLPIFKYDKETMVQEDCAGIAGGTAEIDNCGVCDTNQTNDCVADCAGIWGGTMVIDCMGECTKRQLYVELWGECYSIENTRLLDLNSNALIGSIPPDIGQLTNLTTLSLGYNNLTGNIPLEMWTLANLTTLSLSYNQFTGSIPPDIGQLTNLTTLSLSYNQFTGSIPPDIGQLTNLTYLYLDYNNLIGKIPSEICIQGVFSPYLTNNKFCPPYPSCIEDYVGKQDTLECEYCIQNPTDPDCK